MPRPTASALRPNQARSCDRRSVAWHGVRSGSTNSVRVDIAGHASGEGTADCQGHVADLSIINKSLMGVWKLRETTMRSIHDRRRSGEGGGHFESRPRAVPPGKRPLTHVHWPGHRVLGRRAGTSLALSMRRHGAMPRRTNVAKPRNPVSTHSSSPRSRSPPLLRPASLRSMGGGRSDRRNCLLSVGSGKTVVVKNDKNFCLFLPKHGQTGRR